MAYRKVHINLSVDDEQYQQYRVSLRGTRFDRNGEVNASAALSYHMQSVVEERRKQEELVIQQQVPSSDILQTNDEFIGNQINKLMENKQDITDAVISRQEPDRQEKIYNYFAPICSNIMDRVQSRESEQEVKERTERIIMTEEDKALLRKYAGSYEKVPIEVTQVRTKLRKYSEQT